MRSSITIVQKSKEGDCPLRRQPLPPTVVRILPQKLLLVLDALECGRLEEIHLRVGFGCSVTDVEGKNIPLDCPFDRRDMDTLIQRLCDGSGYALSGCIDRGYICPGGGVRVGLCGCACERTDGKDAPSVQRIDAICIRLPGAFVSVGRGILSCVRDYFPMGTLFYSPPGIGKTTLLRALAAALSSGEHPLRVALIDSRKELDDGSFGGQRCLDILSGYPKREGMEIAARTLNAQVILCDELGAKEARAALSATLYGVPLIATAHAIHWKQLLARPEMRLLHGARTFGAYIGLHRKRPGEDYHYTVTPWEDIGGI